MIISELARISDHLSVALGAMGLDTGAFTFFLYAFYQREKYLRHFRVALRGSVYQQLHACRRRHA